MQSDQKLGIVLAILLIGFTAAFCFPRNPFNEAELLAVEEDLELDAEIQTLPVRAYTSLDAPRASRAKAPAEELTITRDDGPGTGDASGYVAPPAIAVPSPVEIGFEVVDFDDDQPQPTASDRNVPASSADAPAANRSETDRSGTDSGQPATYTVQYGDTLSGLAIRFLGTSRRYLELYEANRDILASPDDLQVGMKLRIPGRSSPEDAAADLEKALEERALEAAEPSDAPQDVSGPLEPARTEPEAMPRTRQSPPSAAGRFRPVRRSRSPLTP